MLTSCLTAPNDTAPNRHTGSIPGLPEFVSPSRAFHLGQVAVALEHQVGDAPNVNIAYSDDVGRAFQLKSATHSD